MNTATQTNYLTKCWIDGKPNVHEMDFPTLQEALIACADSMKECPLDAVCLEIHSVRYVGSVREENLLHRWKQDYRLGGFRQTIYDGTETLS